MAARAAPTLYDEVTPMYEDAVLALQKTYMETQPHSMEYTYGFMDALAVVRDEAEKADIRHYRTFIRGSQGLIREIVRLLEEAEEATLELIYEILK